MASRQLLLVTALGARWISLDVFGTHASELFVSSIKMGKINGHLEQKKGEKIRKLTNNFKILFKIIIFFILKSGLMRQALTL